MSRSGIPSVIFTGTFSSAANSSAAFLAMSKPWRCDAGAGADQRPAATLPRLGRGPAAAQRHCAAAAAGARASQITRGWRPSAKWRCAWRISSPGRGTGRVSTEAPPARAPAQAREPRRSGQRRCGQRTNKQHRAGGAVTAGRGAQAQVHVRPNCRVRVARQRPAGADAAHSGAAECSMACSALAAAMRAPKRSGRRHSCRSAVARALGCAARRRGTRTR